MAIIQTSKIQIRRGTTIDLPGAPKTLSPLTFAPALDTGEFAFLTDSGRLFIGADPAVGQKNYARTSFPYQNIEVLTENSTGVFDALIGKQSRETGSSSFFTSALQASTVAWQDVLIPSASGSPVAYVMAGKTLLATIEYYVYGPDQDPLRAGTLHVLQNSTAAEAKLVETRVSATRADITTSDDDLSIVEQNIEFRIYRSETGINSHFRFSYRNFLPVPATMFFKVTRPIIS